MRLVRNSIRTKFVLLTLGVIMMTVVGIGGTGVYYAVKAMNSSTNKTLDSICHEEGAVLDNLFLSIEQSVSIVKDYALQKENVVKALSESNTRYEYIRDLKHLMLGAANGTPGAVAIYLRFNPEIVPAGNGIFFSVSDSKEGLEERVVSEHSIRFAQDSLDWYNRAVEEGGSIWTKPHNNGEILEEVVSYAVPLFKDGALIGVVGMDILFEDIVKLIDDIQIYDTGYAYMLDQHHEMIYHPLGEDKCPVEHDHEEWDAFAAERDAGIDHDSVFEYRYQGRRMKMTYCTIENGMRLVVTAPVEETDLSKYEMLKHMPAVFLAIIIVSVSITLIMTQSIIRPLRNLTEAAKEIAEGNLEVPLAYPSKDEVGILSNSLQQTVDCLRIYMDRMSDMAYTDPLTGVKSKSAYAEEVRKVNNSIQMGFDQFGVLMMDINGLKQINDNYGHEAGDSYIKHCCRLICTTFKRSPVFRIGGDEFVIFLIGDDLISADRLLKRFEERMKEKVSRAKRPEEKVSVAWGLAVYDEKLDKEYQDVFRRADEVMYENKAKMKKELT